VRRLVAAGVALAVAALAAPTLADPPPVKLAIERYVLDNGLEVVLNEDHRTPVVAVSIWYRVGSKDDPPGRNGFAHLFEHLMFRGSKNVPSDMHWKYVERAGGEANAQTYLDWTRYYETLPSNELALALWLESDRMASLLDRLNQATFATEREVVQNERRQNWENAPYGLVGQLISTSFYPKDHPYLLFPIGTSADLDAATLDDVRRFFKTFYVPNNASMVIAGDIDRVQAKALVAKYFAPIPRGAPPPVAVTPVPPKLDGERRVDIEADVELAQLIVKWPTPPSFARDDAELDVAALALGWGKASRLYKRLVHDLGVAQDVSAGPSTRLLANEFSVKITLKKGKDPGAALKIVDEELERFRRDGPTAAEVERARSRILLDKVFDAEGLRARANMLNELIVYTRDADHFAESLARYERATPDGVKAAVVRWLPKDARVVAFVWPTPGAPRCGRLKGTP
jgi:zinc protease